MKCDILPKKRPTKVCTVMYQEKMCDLVLIDLQIKLLLFLSMTFSCFSFGLFFCFLIGTHYDWSLILYGTSSDPLKPLPEVDTTLMSHTISTSDVNIIQPTEPSRNPTRTQPAPTKPTKTTKTNGTIAPARYGNLFIVPTSIC